MPKMKVTITVAEALNGLDWLLDRQPCETYKELPDGSTMMVDGIVSVDDCIDTAIDEGYVDAGDALAGIDPGGRNLADGLRSLIEGDRAMAATLLMRCFSDWPEASRVVEDVLLGRTHHDRRQRALALAA